MRGIAIIGFLIVTGASVMISQTNRPSKEKDWQSKRQEMVQRQIKSRGISDERVLEAMSRVPRHAFVPRSQARFAYEDYPLPIGYGQTISQPYIVAFMTEQLQLSGKERVLEIGTGSAYQAAVLAELADSVFTIEIVEPLCREGIERLDSLGYSHVKAACGDGYNGWPEKAPFDAIMITAAPPHIPQPLLEQLAVGGRLISPIGEAFQDLILVHKTSESQFHQRKLLPVRFVPMTGRAENPENTTPQ
ncbi:protein-L-isoaspartate(D-aspartate) O-methyltransferase [candidate division KSB1 bacterium]|nr:protein-L-isoaspartate(D-aspartate) O-methyltransferase [candidate division KSB1 bacterium]